MKRPRQIEDGNAESLLTNISPLHDAESAAVGVREALIVIGLGFATVGLMRLVLAVLHTGGQLW